MIKVGVDIGGTFTDIVCVRDDRTLHGAKVPSTPEELIRGVLEAVDALVETTGLDRAEISELAHSSTIATNAILEGKGARVGMLTNKGFEDVLEIGKQNRSRLYDLFLDPETPSFIAPRRVRIGVDGRVDAEGRVVTPLDEAGVATAARHLVDRHGVEALAVCYLFSFRNPEHERRTRDIVRGLYPTLGVSLSSDVMPVAREYPRACLTAFDAYIRPAGETYLRALEKVLAGYGAGIRLQIMLSRGGLSSVDRAVRRPAMMIASGPAAGVIGAQVVGDEVGIADFVSVDVGGTSADIALVTDGRARRTTEGRIKGYPLPLPMVDVVSIGAGGGSIVWLDSDGGLRVGPQSAGARPGPACYRHGGVDATATDASVVLGYLNPDYFAGGRVRLDPEAAWRAVGAIGERLGLAPAQAAHGIHRVLNARMADQIKLMTLLRGHDPRDLWLLVAGGAGPIHGGPLLRELGMRGVIVPRTPGLIAAYGLLVADVEHDHAQTVHIPTMAVDYEAINGLVAGFDDAGRRELGEEGVPAGEIEMRATVDLRYVGQSYELEVPIECPVGPGAMEAAVSAFHEAHARVYGHSMAEDPTEILNVRVTHVARTPRPAIGSDGERRAPAKPRVHRDVYFAEAGDYVATPVFDRHALPAGLELPGPAVLEQRDTTTVVVPGQVCRVHPTGHLLISQAGGAR